VNGSVSSSEENKMKFHKNELLSLLSFSFLCIAILFFISTLIISLDITFTFDGLAAQQAACETPQAIAICASNDIVATDPGAEHDATGQSLEAPHRDGAAAGISARVGVSANPTNRDLPIPHNQRR
jgi:hypothetical protein